MIARQLSRARLRRRSVRSEGSWSRRRWWLLIALVFAAHIGFISRLATARPITRARPRRAGAASRRGFERAARAQRPHALRAAARESFAARAWLKNSDAQDRAVRWTEPPRLLSLPARQLGARFARFMQTNCVAPLELETKPAPELASPVAPENRSGDSRALDVAPRGRTRESPVAQSAGTARTIVGGRAVEQRGAGRGAR